MGSCRMELGVVGKGKRRKLQSSHIEKGQKRGMKIARDQGGSRHVKGIKEVKDVVIMAYGGNLKITETLRLWGLVSCELEFLWKRS